MSHTNHDSPLRLSTLSNHNLFEPQKASPPSHVEHMNESCHIFASTSHTNHDSPCASVASAITIFFSRNFQLSTEAHDLFFKNSRENANFDTRSPRCVPGARGRRSRSTNIVGSFGKYVGLFGYILGVPGARRCGYLRNRSLLQDIVFSVGKLLSADRF